MLRGSQFRVWTRLMLEIAMQNTSFESIRKIYRKDLSWAYRDAVCFIRWFKHNGTETPRFCAFTPERAISAWSQFINNTLNHFYRLWNRTMTNNIKYRLIFLILQYEFYINNNKYQFAERKHFCQTRFAKKKASAFHFYICIYDA